MTITATRILTLTTLLMMLAGVHAVSRAGETTTLAAGLRHVFTVDKQRLTIDVPTRLCVWDNPETLPVGDLRHKIKRAGVSVSLVLVDCRDVDKVRHLKAGDKFDAVIVAPMALHGRSIRTGSTEATALSLYLRQFLMLKPERQKQVLLDVSGPLLGQGGLQIDRAAAESLQIVPGRAEPHIRGAVKLGSAGTAYGTVTMAPLGKIMGLFLSVSGNRPTDLDRLQRELDRMALSVSG